MITERSYKACKHTKQTHLRVSFFNLLLSKLLHVRVVLKDFFAELLMFHHHLRLCLLRTALELITHCMNLTKENKERRVGGRDRDTESRQYIAQS